MCFRDYRRFCESNKSDDDLITYWQRNGTRGLYKIIKEGLSSIMMNQMEKLARDAFMKMPYALYGDGAGGFSGTGFNTIGAADVIKTRLLSDIRLGMFERDNPAFDIPEVRLGETLICITSPGVIEDLRFEASNTHNSPSFIDVMKYANPRTILTGEVGLYHGVRFLRSNNAVLYNAGAIIQQSTITVPVMAGDGSPDPTAEAVDTLEFVGQPGATHQINVSAVDNFKVGDVVTIHRNRTDRYGVVGGVDYTDGKLQNRRIVAVSGTIGAGWIKFDRPILINFSTDLTGGGVYGYVTKGHNVHSMLFLSARDGVVIGMAQPHIVHQPKPFDDLEMMFRVTFDGYFGLSPFNKNSAELVYVSGSNRLVGPRYITK